MKFQMLKMTMIASVASFIVACEKTDRSFSLLDDSSTFQNIPTFTPRPIDIVWVVDNSGSMESSQDNLTANFESFIESFQTKGYDFRMVVTGSDAWRAEYTGNASFKDKVRRWRRGEVVNAGGGNYIYSPDSGIHVMDRLTVDLMNVFLINATLGTGGSGNERAFESLEESLLYADNSDFRRPGAYLAVIVVSDEDDFSSNSSAAVENDYDDELNSDPVVLPPGNHIYNLYQDARLTPVSHFNDLLRNNAGGDDLYSVNTIAIMDTACKTALNDSFTGRRIGRRYLDLATMSGGVKASLCDDFGASLELISANIISTAVSFTLDREPRPETIVVKVNGSIIPNDPVNGWTYNPANWTITFASAAAPAANAEIQIAYTPLRADN